MHVSVCCHLSVLLFTDVLSRIVFWFVIHSVVDMLWEHTAHHLQRQVFLHQTSLLCSSSPVPTLPQGHSVCRREALDGFCGELRYSVIPDLAFSSFRQRSCHSPWSLTAMLGFDGSHKMQRSPKYFCHHLRRQNSRHPFHLQQPCFFFLSTDSSLSLPPTHSLYSR